MVMINKNEVMNGSDWSIVNKFFFNSNILLIS